MGACGEFASHRFKAYGTNEPAKHCVRCGRRHCDYPERRAEQVVGSPSRATPLGSRLVPSSQGVSANAVRPDWTARLVGFGRKHPNVVWVIRDGTITRTGYHKDFWQVTR